MTRLLCVLAAITLTGSTRLPCQPEAEPAEGLAAHPIAAMIGLWRGAASNLGRDNQWHEAQAVERARWNLAGTAILVEGYGYIEDAQTHERTVGHDAFGLIELQEDEVAFYARRAGADFERRVIETLPDGRLRWSMQARGATMRFTITLTEDRWHEIGEMSRDGERWSRIIETDLHRVDR
ncbi:MAG: hypothetical protein H6811_09785 [Phycisphaeraceae bacterium]|nr:hypothetical protein [Phycisphaeraceae bacterium]